MIGVSTNKKEFVRAGVDLLVALLDGSRFNQVTLKSCEGYALVASLLREDALGALSPELLPALDRLRRASGVENESVSVGLVLDLHLWSLADDETQSAHVKTSTFDETKRRPNRFFPIFSRFPRDFWPCSLDSWRPDAENGRKMGKNG